LFHHVSAIHLVRYGLVGQWLDIPWLVNGNSSLVPCNSYHFMRPGWSVKLRSSTKSGVSQLSSKSPNQRTKLHFKSQKDHGFNPQPQSIQNPNRNLVESQFLQFELCEIHMIHPVCEVKSIHLRVHIVFANLNS